VDLYGFFPNPVETGSFPPSPPLRRLLPWCPPPLFLGLVEFLVSLSDSSELEWFWGPVFFRQGKPPPPPLMRIRLDLFLFPPPHHRLAYLATHFKVAGYDAQSPVRVRNEVFLGGSALPFASSHQGLFFSLGTVSSRPEGSCPGVFLAGRYH